MVVGHMCSFIVLSLVVLFCNRSYLVICFVSVVMVSVLVFSILSSINLCGIVLATAWLCLCLFGTIICRDCLCCIHVLNSLCVVYCSHFEFLFCVWR